MAEILIVRFFKDGAHYGVIKFKRRVTTTTIGQLRQLELEDDAMEAYLRDLVYRNSASLCVSGGIRPDSLARYWEGILDAVGLLLERFPSLRAYASDVDPEIPPKGTNF
jgi:hypothetical protein